MRLDQLIDKCDLYRYLYKHDATGMRRDEYYKNLLTEHAKQNGYKVQLYFKQDQTPFVPMSDWTENLEEYGN
jgi:hypothetical protein